MYIYETDNRFIIDPFAKKYDDEANISDGSFIVIKDEKTVFVTPYTKRLTLKEARKYNHGLQKAMKFLKDLNKNV